MKYSAACEQGTDVARARIDQCGRGLCINRRGKRFNGPIPQLAPGETLETRAEAGKITPAVFAAIRRCAETELEFDARRNVVLRNIPGIQFRTVAARAAGPFGQCRLPDGAFKP